jgi:hypothetical protein
MLSIDFSAFFEACAAKLGTDIPISKVMTPNTDTMRNMVPLPSSIIQAETAGTLKPTICEL